MGEWGSGVVVSGKWHKKILKRFLKLINKPYHTSMFKNLLNIKKNNSEFGEIISKVNDNVIIYKTNVEKLRTKISCINWNKNRPHDTVRVNDIKEHYLKKKTTILPGIIYGWKNNHILEIYDGIHRLLEAFEMGALDILIQIYYTDDESLIIEDFKNINKSISVPVIYLEQNNFIKRRVCENVAIHLCEKYPRFISPSRNCHPQNFNRDNVIDLVSKLQVDFGIKNLENIIIQELAGLNYQAKDYVIKNKIQVPQKSNYHNFYLFFLEGSFIRTKLEFSINRDY